MKLESGPTAVGYCILPLTAFLVLTGCHSAPATPKPAQDQLVEATTEQPTEIDEWAMAPKGSGEGYSIKILRSGKIEYRHIDGSSSRGNYTAEIRPDTWREIVHQVDSTQFRQLKQSYPSSTTDTGSTSLTVKWGPRSKEVTSDGWGSPPQLFHQVIDSIEDAAFFAGKLTPTK